MKRCKIGLALGIVLLFCILPANVQAKGGSAVKKYTAEYTVAKGKKANIKDIVSKNISITKINVNQYKWESKNPKTLKINKNLSISAVKKGRAYIEGKSKKGNKNKVFIKVMVGNPTKKIEVTNGSYVKNIGQSVKLTAKVKPTNATNKKVIYLSEDPKVAKVNAYGKVVCLAPGKTTIQIYAKDSCSKTAVAIVVNPKLVTQTAYGAVEGILQNNEDSVVAWLGIPYASPPVGELRWKAPRDPEPWIGIRMAKNYANKAAQIGSGGKLSGSEDCLYLNVYRPNTSETNLPVMVYLHGGGNVSGNSQKDYGNLCSATNSIIVSVEYRLGAFGWLNIPALKTGDPEEDSGNFALLDIKKSLEWVSGNIGEFGGNYGNVTIVGFSAGARNVLACLISPTMEGLFHKAMVLSGGMATVTPEVGQESAYGKLAKILVKKGKCETIQNARIWLKEATREEWRDFLYGLSTYEIANLYKFFGLRMENAPQLFSDGYVLPKDGFQAVKDGTYYKVPILIGSSSQEFSNYALSTSYTEGTEAMNAFRTGWNMFDMILAAKEYGSMLQTSWYLEQNAQVLVRNVDQPKIYAYRFQWGNDPEVTGDFYSNFIGSRHGSDLQFINGTWKNSYEEYAVDLFNNDNYYGRIALSEKMQQYIGNFLKTGNPNGKSLKTWNAWNEVSDKKKVMHFNADKDKDTSKMSTEHIDRDSVIKKMKSNLPSAQYGILMDYVFKGRYFMTTEENKIRTDGETLDNDNLTEDIFKNED